MQSSVVTSITCSKCKRSESTEINQYKTGSEVIATFGWIDHHEGLFCPQCYEQRQIDKQDNRLEIRIDGKIHKIVEFRAAKPDELAINEHAQIVNRGSRRPCFILKRMEE